MSIIKKSEVKKRGRPPGSKNKKRRAKPSPQGNQSKARSDDSIEATIRHLLDLPTSAETKIKLTKAALDV